MDGCMSGRRMSLVKGKEACGEKAPISWSSALALESSLPRTTRLILPSAPRTPLFAPPRGRAKQEQSRSASHGPYGRLGTKAWRQRRQRPRTRPRRSSRTASFCAARPASASPACLPQPRSTASGHAWPSPTTSRPHASPCYRACGRPARSLRRPDAQRARPRRASPRTRLQLRSPTCACRRRASARDPSLARAHRQGQGGRCRRHCSICPRPAAALGRRSTLTPQPDLF
jgi:hypothetical protein